MPVPVLPIIIVYKVVIIIVCFANDNRVKVLENDKEVEKTIEETKKDDMVLAFDGKEKKYAKVLRNLKMEGNFEFFVIKARSLNNPEKTKEVKVTGEHVMITFENKENIKLILAKNLEGNEYLDTDDGLYQIYQIEKELRNSKYMLTVKGGVTYANGIFISTICSDNEAKVERPTQKEWEIYQNNKALDEIPN